MLAWLPDVAGATRTGDRGFLKEIGNGSCAPHRRHAPSAGIRCGRVPNEDTALAAHMGQCADHACSLGIGRARGHASFHSTCGDDTDAPRRTAVVQTPAAYVE